MADGSVTRNRPGKGRGDSRERPTSGQKPQRDWLALVRHPLTIVIIGTVILGGIGYVLKYLLENAMENTRLLGKIEGQQAYIAQRVDRIAQALPDLKVRIAHEELYQLPIKTLILTTNPQKDNRGQLVAKFHIVDTENGQVYTYVKPVSGEAEWQREKYVTVGRACSMEASCISVKQLTKWAAEIQPRVALTVPYFVDSEASFLLRSVSAESFIEALQPYQATPSVTKWERPLRCSSGYDILVDLGTRSDEYYHLGTQAP